MPNKDEAEKGDHPVEKKADGHRHGQTQDATDFCIIVLPKPVESSHLSSDTYVSGPAHADYLVVCTGQPPCC